MHPLALTTVLHLSATLAVLGLPALSIGKEPPEQYFQVGHVTTVVRATGVDKAAAKRFLDLVLTYSQEHPEDKLTSRVLRNLGFFAIDDFVEGWYAIEIAGEVGNALAYLLVDQAGRVLQATPQNCLRACKRDFFRQVWDIDAVKALCAKVLQGSHHGVIVSQEKDIPGYETKPLPDGKRRILAPLVKYRLNGRTVYRFFAYQQLGGIVWECKLLIEDDDLSLSWDMREIARDIGDADYLE
jgi:hypothetical protein